MSVWTDQLRDSPVFGLRDQLVPIVEQCLARPDLSEPQTDDLRRLVSVVEFCVGLLTETDPDSVPLNLHSALGAHLNYISTELSAAMVGDLTRIPNAVARVDSLLTDVRLLPPGRPRKTSQAAGRHAKAILIELQRAESEINIAVTDAGNAITKTVDEAKDLVSTIQQEATARWAALRGELDSIETRIDTTRSALQASLNTLAAKVDTETQRVDAFVATGATELSVVRTQATTSFQMDRETQMALFANQQARIEKESEKLFTDYQIKLDALVTYFEERKALANQALGLTGALGTAEAYLKEADGHKRAARYWYGIAIAVWTAAVGAALWLAHDISSSTATLSTERILAITSARLGFAGISVAFAVWVTRQAGNHRGHGQQAEAIASELTTLRPFIAELELTDQQRIIKEVFVKYFLGKSNQVSPPPAVPTAGA